MQNVPVIGISIWSIFKWFGVFAMGLYLIFAVVIVRQVQLMNNTLEVGFEKPVMFLAILHLLFAIGVLLLAIVIL